MVEVTPGVKSTSSSSFSIDAIISKDGGPVTASSPVPQYADARLCAAQPPTSSSTYLDHLHRHHLQEQQSRGVVTGGDSRLQSLPGHLSPTRGIVVRSDGTGKSITRGNGSGVIGTGSMDVLTASAPRHHLHPMSLAAVSSASSALLSTSSMASQLPPHHPHFPSPGLSSPHHPSPHHPIPHHHLLSAVSDSAAASFFSAASKSQMYSSMSGLHGGPHDHLGSSASAHTAGLFGQSPLGAYAGMSQAAAAAEASGLSTLHALASQKSALQHAGSALHGLAGGMTIPGVHQQFPLYSRLSWPYFHRYTGSEPSFLLPFRKPKRIRTAFSPSQLLRLEHAFEKNHYVVGQERKDLAINLSLTETQVKVWFQNRRTKHKRVTTEEEQEKGRGNKSSPDNSRDEDDMMDD